MAEIPMVCKHLTLRFHSGGYYIQCAECQAWWCAIKGAHGPDQELDHDRPAHSAVVGGEARSLVIGGR